jgi:hypothetical protein
VILYGYTINFLYDKISCRKKLNISVLAFVVNITVLLNLKARAEENFGTYFHEREKLSEEAAYFKAEAGIKDNDNVLVVGNGCHYYLLTDTYSKSKYPYCPPATFDNEKTVRNISMR